MKKGYLIVGGVGVGLLGLAFAMNLFLSFGASRAADRFLDHLSAGQTALAYQMTTKGFRQETKAAEFSRMARRWKLKGFTGTEDWENQPGNGQVMITANIKRKDGSVVPLILKVTKEEGDWRIARVQGPPDPSPHYTVTKGLGYYRERNRPAGERLPALPPKEEVSRLVRTSLLDLEKASRTGDFRSFRSSVSERWQEEMPLVIFQRVLGDLSKEGLTLSGIEESRPSFDPAPQIAHDGTLQARGKYRLDDSMLDFHLGYLVEDSKWKLVSFWVGSRPPLPDELEE